MISAIVSCRSPRSNSMYSRAIAPGDAAYRGSAPLVCHRGTHLDQIARQHYTTRETVRAWLHAAEVSVQPRLVGSIASKEAFPVAVRNSLGSHIKRGILLSFENFFHRSRG